MRAFAGKLGWLGRLSRPDLIFAQIEASSVITRATVADLKHLQKAVTKIKQEQNIVCIPKLPSDVRDWKLATYTDAAWQNLAESRTEESARLLPLLNADNTSTDIVLPAALHMLRKSLHHTLSVESNVPDIPDSLQGSFVDMPSSATICRPCSQALALVESSEASHLVQIWTLVLPCTTGLDHGEQLILKDFRRHHLAQQDARKRI